MCFPVLAQAEGSSGVQYETGLPSAGPHHHSSEHQPIAKSSNQGGGGTPSNTSSHEPAPAEVNSGGVPSQTVKTGSESLPEPHQPSPHHGQSTAKQNPAPSPALHAAEKSPSSGGESSPLVPILIALAALAAVSLGVFLVRQRRHHGAEGGLSTPRAG